MISNSRVKTGQIIVDRVDSEEAGFRRYNKEESKRKALTIAAWKWHRLKEYNFTQMKTWLSVKGARRYDSLEWKSSVIRFGVPACIA